MKRLVVLGTLLFAVGALAYAAPTEVTVNWDAWGGFVEGTFVNGDDSDGYVLAVGHHFWGTFFGKDGDDNPYSYGVDSGTFTLMGNAAGGGHIYYEVNRTESYPIGMYGPAGQQHLAEILTDDGTLFLGLRTTTSYASMKSCNYGFQANNQLQVSGSAIAMYHQISTGDGDWAKAEVWGAGSASFTYMNNHMGGTAFRFGRGCGCYDNCGATGTGSGVFELSGAGANSLAGDGWSAPSGGTYLQQIVYTGGFTVDDPFMLGD